MESLKLYTENTRFPAAFTFRSSSQGQLITIEEALPQTEESEPYYCYGCIQMDLQSRVEVTPISGNNPFFRLRDSEQEHVMGCPYHRPDQYMGKLAKQLQMSYQDQQIELAMLPFTQPQSFLNHSLEKRWSLFVQKDTKKWMTWIQEIGLYDPYLSIFKTSSFQLLLAEKTKIPLKNLLLYTQPDEQNLQLMLVRGVISEISEHGNQWNITITPFESDKHQSVHLQCSRFLHSPQAIAQLVKKRVAVWGYVSQEENEYLMMEIYSLNHQLAILGELQLPSLHSSVQILSQYFYEKLFLKGTEYYPLQICENSFLGPYFQQRLQEEEPQYQSEQHQLATELKKHREEREKWKRQISELNRKKEVLEKRLEAIQVAIQETSFILTILGKNLQRKAKRKQMQKELNQVQDELAEAEMNYSKARRHAKQISQELEELHHDWVVLEKGVITENSRKKPFQEMIIWEIPSGSEDEYMVVGVDIHYSLPRVSVTASIQYCRKEKKGYIPMLKYSERFSSGSWHSQNMEEIIEECWAQVYRKIELMN